MGRIGIKVAAALLVLLAARGAGAFVCKVSEDYSYVSLHWPSRLITYGVQSPGSKLLTNEVTLRAVDSAFREWSTPDCTDLHFAGRGMVEPGATGVNKVVFIGSSWPHARDAVALTRTTYGTENGVIRSATIDVNEDVFILRDVSQGCPPRPPTYDLTAVLTHEVGHVIGLDHTQPENYRNHAPSDPTMAPDVGTCEMDKRTIKPDDIAGLCLLYPRGQPSRSCDTLPAQATAYVSNTPFGCSAGPRPVRSDRPPWGLLVGFALLVAVRRSRRA